MTTSTLSFDAFELYITELLTKYIITFAKFSFRYNHLLIASFIGSKICTLCADGETRDEYHYLLRCVYFYNERIKIIDAKYAKHPSRHSFSELMNCRKCNELRKLITFMNIILQKVKTINWTLTLCDLLYYCMYIVLYL